jgi:cytochrome c oxidase cbb3-type subunit 2
MKTALVILSTALCCAIFFGPQLQGQPTPPTDGPVSASADVLARGRLVYDGICAACHGKDGRGDGPIAANLQTKPRDFTGGFFKDRSTASGQLPTDFDLLRTVTNGIHNSTMPAFKNMAAADRWDVVQYLKTFSPRFADPKEYPLSILNIGEPVAMSPTSVARGRGTFARAQCWKCHGANGAGDGPSADTFVDQWGEKDHAVDLTDPSGYKFALTRTDIYRIFSTGLNGAPMPSFYDALGDSTRWDLVNYVWGLRHEDEFMDGRSIEELSSQVQ